MSTTTNTGLNKPDYNSTVPTWDQPLNYNETILDSIFGNTTSVAMPTGATSTTTLTGPASSGSLGQTQSMRILLTGALSANQYLQIPAGIGGRWIVYNTCTGTSNVYITSGGGGTSVVAPQSYNVSIYSDGTNIRYTDDGLTNNFANLTVLGNTYLATQSGSVGIGTTSPSTLLTVNGTVTATSYSGAGTGLTGTASSLNIGGNAATATNATNAVNATNATNATNANYATSAGNASTATNATNAVNLSGGSVSATTITATGNITAYYSDDRLKTHLGGIDNALDKVSSLKGFYYEANETAQSLGYEPVREVGVSAQDVQAILPEIVAPAPIDPQYLTVRYERLVPLLIEAIKELTNRVKELEAK